MIRNILKSSKLKINKTFQSGKNTYENSSPASCLMGKERFPPKVENQTRMVPSHTSQHCVEGLRLGDTKENK